MANLLDRSLDEYALQLVNARTLLTAATEYETTGQDEAQEADEAHLNLVQETLLAHTTYAYSSYRCQSGLTSGISESLRLKWKEAGSTTCTTTALSRSLRAVLSLQGTTQKLQRPNYR